jgi:hypothetical protein
VTDQRLAQLGEGLLLATDFIPMQGGPRGTLSDQVPIEHWHEVIADPTIADAVLDRLVHNAHRLILKGDSMRKIAAQRANLDAVKKT